MKITTIIQARMGSTRLPGKVMLDLCGQTVLSRVVARVRRSKLAGMLVVATSIDAADDILVDECRRLQLGVFRGSEDDVLGRYYGAAKSCGADAIVRICSDCPLIDPEIIDLTIQTFLDSRSDYASNALDRTFPRGLDTEVMTWLALQRSWSEANAFYQRSHVTPYIYENPDQFKIARVRCQQSYGDYRWTLDTLEDLQFIRAIYERVENLVSFGWRDVLRILEDEPHLAEMNQHIPEKALVDG